MESEPPEPDLRVAESPGGEDEPPSLEHLLPRVLKTIVVPRPGTQRYGKQYGDSLLCVRYRYDAARKLRFTTVELVVSSGPWEPRTRDPESPVHIRIRFDEIE